MLAKEEFNEVFGNFVKYKRKSKSWSQSKLAATIGNNAQNISRIERGELSPTLFWVSKLSHGFEMELDQLIIEFMTYYRSEWKGNSEV